VRINPLRLRVEVPERDASSVAVGQAVRVTVTGQTEVHLGKVARMSPSLSEQTRTLTVEAEIPNPGTLRPGSFARGEIAIEDGGQALLVPASALVTFAGIEKVLMVEEGKAIEKRVSTGRRTAEQVEVLTGLQAGDLVVAAPGNLQQGQPVAVEAR
jgi:RND family efflux transporter MFP subunit